MYEQIRTVDKQRVLGYIGRLNEYEMNVMNEKIKISLGLEE